MNQLLIKLLPIAFLFLLILAPFAGLAPIMLLLFGYAVYWTLLTLVQAFLSNPEPDESRDA